MKKVTFITYFKLEDKEYKNYIIEYTEATIEMIKLRASALNCTIATIEDVK